MRDDDSYAGWRCKTGDGPAPEVSEDYFKRLEDEVVAEVMENKKREAEGGDQVRLSATYTTP